MGMAAWEAALPRRCRAGSLNNKHPVARASCLRPRQPRQGEPMARGRTRNRLELRAAAEAAERREKEERDPAAEEEEEAGDEEAEAEEDVSEAGDEEEAEAEAPKKPKKA